MTDARMASRPAGAMPGAAVKTGPATGIPASAGQTAGKRPSVGLGTGKDTGTPGRAGPGARMPSQATVRTVPRAAGVPTTLGRPAPTPRRRMRGTLGVLAVFLVASGMIRLGTGVGEALTRAPEAVTASLPLAEAPPPDVAPLLAALSAREARLAEAEATLDDRLRALSVAEEEFERQRSALIAAEAALSATLVLADQAAERDIARLTAVYEAMKPQQAAALFEEMDPTFAAGFLGRMRADAAASVMAGLTPGAAYTISVILAGRHVGVPTE
jgi:flagellar motility protein MotE (MotC chaperone)